MSPIYFDNFTTTEVTSKVEVSYAKWLSRLKTAYNAPYEKDLALFKEINQAIASLYELVGAESKDQFYFSSREQDALRHLFLELVLPHMFETGRNHILTLDPLSKAVPGCVEFILEVNEHGQVTPELLEKAITPRTSIVILPWVNRITGIIQPIWELGEICRKKEVLFLVKGSEIFAKLFFRFQDLSIDILTFEGDKFHAPKGSGGFFVKGSSAALRYLKKETIPYDAVAALISMGVAARETLDYMDGMCTEIARLRANFEDRLQKEIPDVVIFGKKGSRVPSTVAFAIPGIHPDLLLFHLAERGIFAARDEQAVSCTFSSQTTNEEVEKAAEQIIEIAKELKKLRMVKNG
jgi:cysteine desulfurase